MIRILPFLFSFTFLIAALNDLNSADNKIDFSPLKATVNSELDQKFTPGAAIALIQKDQILFSQGFGNANEEKETPVSADMLFQVGSMTKMMTAIVLTSLGEEGKVDLNAPIGTYVKGLNSRIGALTCHQLLSQTSGLKDMPGEYGSSDERDFPKFIRSLREDIILADPGMAFSYSNLNYAIAGLVIQEVVGKAYADVMSERLFLPLGMKRTM
ncbi:MAG TPA: serine hydrolase domain-containing protein, partial [Acidobacteriota bacterium]|nr:serine hydrolase domain-containing protein [Acidobacteriota bacterium]